MSAITPAEALLTRDGLRRHLLARLPDMVERAACSDMDASTAHHILAVLAQTLDHFVPVLWRADLFEAALAGCQAFYDAPMLPEWVPEENLLVIPPRMPIFSGDLAAGWEVPDPSMMAAMLICRSQASDGPRRGDAGLLGVNVFCHAPGGHWQRPEPLPYLRITQIALPGDPLHPAAAEMVAMLAFLQQRIAVAEPTPLPLPRADRRRYTREGRPEPQVRTVVLRRPEREPKDAAPGHGCVDWQHSWLQKGHWRRLESARYTHKQGQVVYVKPCVKGPADKPLKAPTSAVIQVKR